MDDREFVAAFADAVGCPVENLTLETPLSSIETWDSVAYLAVMTLVDDKMGVALNPEKLVEAKRVGDILSLARTESAAQ